MPEPSKLPKQISTPRSMTEAKPGRSVGFWVFISLAGMAVLAIGGFAFFVLFVRASVESAARDAEWQTVVSDHGGFSAELPAEIVFEEESEPTKGWKLHIGTAQVGDVAFEISYFDLPESARARGDFDLANMMSRVHGAQHGRVSEIESRAMGDCPGQFSIINLDNGRQTHGWGFTRGSRVYILAAHNLRPEDADLAERFFNSFELRDIVAPAPEYESVDGTPRSLSDDDYSSYTAVDLGLDTLRPAFLGLAFGEPLKFERGQIQRKTIDFANGEPPYRVELMDTDLPDGLTASVEGDTIHVSGIPTEAGTFSIDYRVTDAAHHLLESTIKIEVIDNPFTISVSGLSFADGVAEVRRGEQLDLAFKLNGPVADDPRLPSWLDEEIPPGLKAGPGEGDHYPVSGKCTRTGRHAVRINVLVKSSEDGEEYECRYEVILNVVE